jgi:glycosyltransferase involved in cell wall biosynthesis
MKSIVFFISDITSSGGTERISFILANYLKSLGYNVSFITLNKSNEDMFFELDKSIDIHVVRSLKANALKDVMCLRRILVSNSFDLIVDVDSVLTPYTFLAKLFRVKIKHVVWEMFNASINLGVRRRDIGRYLAVKFADKTVVLTREDKEIWTSKYKAKNVEVIYNPVTSSYTKKVKHFDSHSRKIILAVGRLAEQKGFDLLLQAWNELSKKISEKVILRIVGDGPDKESLMNYVMNNKLEENVDFYGRCSNLSIVYNDAYAYVLSSRHEGFVLSLLEAMAAGLPVISYDCPCGPRELLSDESGMLIENGSISEMAKALEEMISKIDHRNQLAEKAYNRSLDFKQSLILPKWQKLIINLYE